MSEKPCISSVSSDSHRPDPSDAANARCNLRSAPPPSDANSCQADGAAMDDPSVMELARKLAALAPPKRAAVEAMIDALQSE